MTDDDAGRPAGRVVGLLADPDRPTELAESLARDRLPRALRDELGADDGSDPPYEVRVGQRAIAAGRATMVDVLDAVRAHRDREGWDLAVYVTDVPVLHGREPVVADVSSGRGVALLCLPALGGLRLRTRMLRVVVALVAALAGTGPVSSSATLTRHLGPTTSHRLDDAGVDERLAVPRCGATPASSRGWCAPTTRGGSWRGWRRRSGRRWRRAHS
jgi:hypothetical protein